MNCMLNFTRIMIMTTGATADTKYNCNGIEVTGVSFHVCRENSSEVSNRREYGKDFHYSCGLSIGGHRSNVAE